MCFFVDDTCPKPVKLDKDIYVFKKFEPNWAATDPSKPIGMPGNELSSSVRATHYLLNVKVHAKKVVAIPTSNRYDTDMLANKEINHLEILDPDNIDCGSHVDHGIHAYISRSAANRGSWHHTYLVKCKVPKGTELMINIRGEIVALEMIPQTVVKDWFTIFDGFHEDIIKSKVKEATNALP